MACKEKSNIKDELNLVSDKTHVLEFGNSVMFMWIWQIKAKSKGGRPSFLAVGHFF